MRSTQQRIHEEKITKEVLEKVGKASVGTYDKRGPEANQTRRRESRGVGKQRGWATKFQKGSTKQVSTVPPIYYHKDKRNSVTGKTG